MGTSGCRGRCQRPPAQAEGVIVAARVLVCVAFLCCASIVFQYELHVSPCTCGNVPIRRFSKRASSQSTVTAFIRQVHSHWLIRVSDASPLPNQDWVMVVGKLLFAVCIAAEGSHRCTAAECLIRVCLALYGGLQRCG